MENNAFEDGMKMKALNEAANKNMIEWDAGSFVEIYPKLLRSIFDAMDIYDKPVTMCMSYMSDGSTACNCKFCGRHESIH